MRFYSNKKLFDNNKFLQLISNYEPNPQQGQRELRWMLEEIESKGLIGKRKEQKLLYWIDSRSKGKPLAYCFGWTPFIDLKIFCRQPVLIPRWETEEWTSKLIQKYQSGIISKPAKILDLCSGSGCISIALAKAFPNSIVDGVDVSPAAIRLARYNQRSAGGIRNLKFHYLDLFSDKTLQFQNYDLIVSNPPYVSLQEYSQLDKSVADFEDSRALLADNDGLQFYQHIVTRKHLFSTGSSLVFEIGDSQGLKVKEIMLKGGFRNIEIVKDGAGTDRLVMGTRPS